jgi:hypothetical protein
MVHNHWPPVKLTPIAAVLVAALARASVGIAAEPAVPVAERPAPESAPSTESTGASESAPQTSKDSSQINTSIDKPETTLPWRNTTLHFEQTVTTQTVGAETSPQLTYVPSYEWWLSFRPRYYITDKLNVNARFDYYKDFTNDAQTTYYRQDIFGDIWANLVYATPVPAISKHTEVSVGARLRFPTSIESQDEGVYLRTGATVGIKQTIPINGLSAKSFSDAHVAVGLWYEHPFSRATTPTNPNLSYTRQDTEGMSFVSDEVSGTTLVNHQLVVSLDSGIQITPRLALNVDMIFFNQWHYGLPDTCVATLTGCASVGTTPGFGTTYTVDTWFVASVDYELFDELELTLGYYNLANELAPDGQRRGLVGQDNIWWSPTAKIFFDITMNLDTIYEWANGKPTHPRFETRTATAPNGQQGASGASSL